MPNGRKVRNNGSVLLTTRSVRRAPALGLMVGYFRANHATGVSSLTRFAGKFSKPGSTALRYSRTGICSLRHVSTIEMMAATRGPAYSLPTWIQFLRPIATGRIEFSVALLLSSSSG